MGIKYNLKYKKGKFGKSAKATKADYAKTAWRNLTYNSDLWKSDTRKYDFPYRDTGADFAEKDSKGGGDRFKKKVFKYKYRSKKKIGKSPSRQNKTYRRYWYK